MSCHALRNAHTLGLQAQIRFVWLAVTMLAGHMMKRYVFTFCFLQAAAASSSITVKRRWCLFKMIGIGPLGFSLTKSSEVMRQVTRKSWSNKKMKLSLVMYAKAALLISTFGYAIFKVSQLPLLEQSICRDYYMSHDPSVISSEGYVPEMLCKKTPIQLNLASLMGWVKFFTLVPGNSNDVSLLASWNDIV